MDLSSASEISNGTKIGPYVVEGRLGEGGAGEVFAATETESGEKVALKVLRPGAEVDETIHARFVREISVAQKLDDPHVVQYKDCGVDEGILFYAMEYVSWGSLHDVLQKRRLLPWREVCECGVQICSGLQHLHDSSIVHRDLKPANIFLSEDGRLKLGDFGLARDFDSHRLTVDGTAVGTAKYLAPEQARGEAEIDGRTDLYALGCNLFEYLTSRTPFAGEDMQDMATFMEMMRRHVEEAPPKVIDLLPTCPPALSDLVDCLLAKDADDRPKSAAVVARALQQILEDPEKPLGEIETSAPDVSEATDETDAGEAEDEAVVANDEVEVEGLESTSDSEEVEASLTERLRGPSTASASPMSQKKILILALIGGAVVAGALIFASQQ